MQNYVENSPPNNLSSNTKISVVNQTGSGGYLSIQIGCLAKLKLFLLEYEITSQLLEKCYFFCKNIQFISFILPLKNNSSKGNLELP